MTPHKFQAKRFLDMQEIHEHMALIPLLDHAGFQNNKSNRKNPKKLTIIIHPLDGCS